MVAAKKGDVLNCCGKMPSLRRAGLPGSFNLPEIIATLPGPIRGSLGREQGESTWDPLNASELAPNSANGLIPSLIAWAESQPPGNVAKVSLTKAITSVPFAYPQFETGTSEIPSAAKPQPHDCTSER